jgi:Calcium-activated chloride channel
MSVLQSPSAEAAYGTFGSGDVQDDPDEFGQRPPWGWDYVLSFQGPGEEEAERTDEPTNPVALREANGARQRILSRLRSAGFVYSQFMARSDQVIHVRIALPEPVQMEKAELMGKQLQLKPNYGSGYLMFTQARSSCFVNDYRCTRGGSYFSSADRILLILAVMRSRDDWGAAVDLEKYKRDGKLLQAFSVHKDDERKSIVKETLASAGVRHSLNDHVLSKMHQYVGGRIAMYFAFVSFYARMLFGMAVLSVLIYFVLQCFPSDVTTSWTRTVFAFFLCLFGTYFTRFWSRRCAILKVKWGLTDFDEENLNSFRPQFVGAVRKSFYSRGGFVSLDDLDASFDPPEVRQGEPHSTLIALGSDGSDFELDVNATSVTFSDLPTVPYSYQDSRWNKLYITATITLFFSLCVAAASFLILFYNDDIMEALDFRGLGAFAPGICTGLLITVCDAIWTQVSFSLTNWENHRSHQLFKDNLIMKRFAFQFVSSMPDSQLCISFLLIRVTSKKWLCTDTRILLPTTLTSLHFDQTISPFSTLPS